jgi:hypothetical protein
MGFIPLPLGVVMVRVLVQALQISTPAAATILVLAYLCIASFRILNSIIILGKACDLMLHFENQQASPEKPPTPLPIVPIETTGPAIFTNSSVSIASVGLNEKLREFAPSGGIDVLREDTPVSEDEDSQDKSPPDSQDDDEEEVDIMNASFLKKRTRSEPSISLSDRNDYE